MTRNECEQPVFDLTVEEIPEFFANGILVHNSTDCLIIARKIVGTLITTGTTPNAEADAQKKRAAEAARKRAPGAEPLDPDERDEEPSRGGSFSGMLVGGFDDSWGNL